MHYTMLQREGSNSDTETENFYERIRIDFISILKGAATGSAENFRGREKEENI